MAGSKQPIALQGLKRCLVLLGNVELAVACLLVFAMIAMVAGEVFYRYVLASSLFWVEEGAMIAFIWITFLGAAVAAKAGRHIRIETFSSRLKGPRARLIWAGSAHLIVLLIAVLLAFYSYGYVAIQSRTLTVSLPFNIPRSWMFAWPLFFGMCSIAATQFYYLMDIVVQKGRAADAGTPLLEV